MSRSLMQGKCIIIFSIAEKTSLPCPSTHSIKVRGKNFKPISPSISYRIKQLLPDIFAELTAGHPEQSYLDKAASWYSHLLNTQKVPFCSPLCPIHKWTPQTTLHSKLSPWLISSFIDSLPATALKSAWEHKYSLLSLLQCVRGRFQ